MDSGKMKNKKDLENQDETSILNFGKTDKVTVIPNECSVQCSILVGKHVAYCMDCGKIYWEYKDKKIIKQLMNPFDEIED